MSALVEGGMDTERILDVLPHYLAMLILVFAVLTVVRTAIGDLGFWIEFVIILAIVFVYRPLVIRLGVAPDAWT